MNLVAKEYIASKIDKKGVLILSEMAGASQEMSEALIINPNSMEEIADALKDALVMPENEQVKRIRIMQQRLKRYNVENWAADFLRALNKVQSIQENYFSKKVTPSVVRSLVNKFKKASKRILFLDYDGTLVGFKDKPEDAFPDKVLLKLLEELSELKNTTVVLISGRGGSFFDKWFKDTKLSFVVEHGVWFKQHGKDWQIFENRNTEWKELISQVLEFYVDRTPGTFIEEKNFSLVWHYRKADPELGTIRANELKDELGSLTANLDIEVLEGHKVIEVKNSGINKGRAAIRMLNNNKYDFILGIGDDWTDEYLFKELPDQSVTIKVGLQYTAALYNIESPEKVRALLSDFVKNP
jgi:trehalose 6-phosphate synthase/phosphatase